MKVSALIFVAVAFLCLANAKVLFTRTNVPAEWTKLNRASPLHPSKFIIALTQRNLDLLDNLFWAVSNPQSPQYQNFMTPEQILDVIAPLPENVQKVMDWLHSHGARNIKNLGDALEVHTNVAVAEKLFSTHFFYFQHSFSNKTLARQFGEYSVPDSIAEHIHMVTGISDFPVPHLKLHSAEDGAQGIVPQSVQSFYGSPSSFTPSTSTSQGVIEFEQQYFAPADLQAFATQVGIPIAALPTANIVGYNDPSQPGDEAELDIEYIAAVGINIPNWFWIEAGTTWLYGFATHFFSTSKVPLVISVSYGWSEADQCEEGIGAEECQALGVNSQGYVSRVNTEFQKIGLRGVSILVASGDSGANGRTDPDCSGSTLLPDYPAASPYVTSVGATQMNNPTYLSNNLPPICSGQGYSCVSGGEEVAVSYQHANFASGGGFSNVAARPSYQTDAVNAYLSSGVKLPPTSYYNQTGRGYPDVAAFGSDVLIEDGGAVQGVGGTSCSSPIFAGVVAMLNEASLKKTGKPLGFLNPLFYQIAASDSSAFNDITVGDNLCTEDGCASTCQGYYATKGWDPVTGLGSPNYASLLKNIEAVLDIKVAQRTESGPQF